MKGTIKFERDKCIVTNPTLRGTHPIVQLIEGIGLIALLPFGWTWQELEKWVRNYKGKIPDLMSGEIQVLVNEKTQKVEQIITF